MKKVLYNLILFISLCSVVFSREYSSSFEKLSETNKKIIIKANSYFDGVKTIKSNFIQYSEFNGSMSEGIFHISKPDKIRFEYTYPSKTLLIMNGSIINYYDIDLDEITTLPKKSNPLFDFFSKQQNLENLDSKIISIKKKENKYFIETNIKVKGVDGIIKVDYIFSENMDRLVSLHFNDGSNGNMEIDFFRTELNIDLKRDLFVFKNPRLQKKKK